VDPNGDTGSSEAAGSDVDEFDTTAGSRSKLLDVGSIRRDYGPTTAEPRLSDGGIDRVDSAVESQRVDFVPLKEASQIGLAATTPSLDSAARGNKRSNAALQGPGMERPHPSIVRFSGNERSGVIAQPER
jgi:hypothetical protein